MWRLMQLEITSDCLHRSRGPMRRFPATDLSEDESKGEMGAAESNESKLCRGLLHTTRTKENVLISRNDRGKEGISSTPHVSRLTL